jgi:hypothetical protein
MNLPSKKEPPLPNPLLHKYVEEREKDAQKVRCALHPKITSRRLTHTHYFGRI